MYLREPEVASKEADATTCPMCGSFSVQQRFIEEKSGNPDFQEALEAMQSVYQGELKDNTITKK